MHWVWISNFITRDQVPDERNAENWFSVLKGAVFHLQFFAKDKFEDFSVLRDINIREPELV